MAVSQYPVPKIIDGDNWLRNPPHPKDKPTLFRCTYVYACQLFRETKKPQLSFFYFTYYLFLLGRKSTIVVLILSIAILRLFLVFFLINLTSVKCLEGTTTCTYSNSFSHTKTVFQEMSQHLKSTHHHSIIMFPFWEIIVKIEHLLRMFQFFPFHM